MPHRIDALPPVLDKINNPYRTDCRPEAVTENRPASPDLLELETTVDRQVVGSDPSIWRLIRDGTSARQIYQ